MALSARGAHARAYYLLLAGVSVGNLVIFLLALKWGSVALSWPELWQSLRGAQAINSVIVRELRLPRAVLAMAIGVLLALSGCAAQGLFRNPLADPSLLGVSAGGSLGAAIAIVLLTPFGFYWLGLSLVSLSAFCGALLVVLLVYRFAQTPYGTSVATMLLAGVGVSFIAGSLTSLLEYLADERMLRQISLWRMGGLDGANFIKVALVLPVALAVTLVIANHARALDALLLGEAEARHLGVAVARVKVWLVVAIAAGVGVSVAFAGTIVFVGLVVPHIARALVGPGHEKLLPLAACLGALFLLAADLLARSIVAPAELPAGLLIALLGAPVFLWLLRNRYQYQE